MQQSHQQLEGRQPGQPEHPLAFFVERLGGLGDVIMALAAIHALRVQHPSARIHLLTEGRYAGLAGLSPHLDGVVTSRQAWTVLMHELAIKKFELRPVNLNAVEFGINRDHQVNAFLLAMGIHAPSADKSPVVAVPDPVRQRSEARLKPLLASARPVRILLHPGQGDKNRTWPAAKWEDLADRVLAAGHTPIVVGDSSTVPFKGVMKLKPRPGLLDLTNQLSLEDTLVLCDHAQVFVSPDSGPVQLAGLSEIGIVGIYSTVPARCRLPFRHGLYAWRAVGVEPTCPHKGCYQVFLEDEEQMARLQQAAHKDLKNPGVQATNTFMGDFCLLERGKYRCLLEEITPEGVWEACQGVMSMDWDAVAATVARARARAEQGDGQGLLDHLAQLPATLANPEVDQLVARALALLGKWSEATRAFSAVLAAAPNVEAYNEVGLIFHSNRRFDQAAHLFRMAKKWNDAYRPAVANGEYMEARRFLDAGEPLRGLLALEGFRTLCREMNPQERAHTLPEAEAQHLWDDLVVAFVQLDEVRRIFGRAAESVQ